MKLILALLLLGLPLFAASVVALTEARDGEEHLLSWPHQLCPPQCIPDKPAHPLTHTYNRCSHGGSAGLVAGHGGRIPQHSMAAARALQHVRQLLF